jgi:hypothetical protein
LRAAREAHAAAVATRDDQAQAYAAFVLGNALLDEFYRGADLLFGEAMQRFDEAAVAYEKLETIDLYTVLITMAGAALTIRELDAAHRLLARVIDDLADRKYATPESVARHVDHLRGRAFMELGIIALADGDDEQAGLHLESAANLLIAARDATSIELLGQLADTIEQELGDVSCAMQIRAAAARLTVPA